MHTLFIITFTFLILNCWKSTAQVTFVLPTEMDTVCASSVPIVMRGGLFDGQPHPNGFYTGVGMDMFGTTFNSMEAYNSLVPEPQDFMARIVLSFSIPNIGTATTTIVIIKDSTKVYKSSSKTKFCLGADSLILKILNPNATDIIWFLDGNNTGVTGNTYRVRASGLHSAEFTNDRNCSVTIFTDSVYFLIPDISLNPTIMMHGDSLRSSSWYNYQWLLNGEIIVGATTEAYKPIENGDYNVFQIDTATGCTLRSDFINIVTNRENKNQILPLIIYPNPIFDKIEIKIPTIDNNKIIVEIWNSIGFKLKEAEFTNNKLIISTADLPKGLYWIKLKNDDNEYIGKILKQ